jgi:hypothetical protein
MNEQKKDDAVPPIPDWLREGAEKVGETFPTTSYLCGAPAAVVGVFVPTTEEVAREFNCVAPEGKTRSIVYALCQACLNTPGAEERVEERFLTDRRLRMGPRVIL